MLVSPFTFFRGAACVMAWDLAQEPRTALKAQLCGDAHLSNFGTFAGPDRRLVFGINDFDETLPGPFEWDVKRLVASFEVAGRDRGFDGVARRSVDLAVARSYREAMRSFAELRTLELWYVHLDRDVEEIVREWASRVSRKQLRYFERNIAKARAKDSLRAFAKLTRVVDGHPRIVHDPPLIVPIEALARADDPRRSRRRSTPSCTTTAAPCHGTGGGSLSDTSTSTPPARSWGWAAWARGPGSC